MPDLDQVDAVELPQGEVVTPPAGVPGIPEGQSINVSYQELLDLAREHPGIRAALVTTRDLIAAEEQVGL